MKTIRLLLAGLAMSLATAGAALADAVDTGIAQIQGEWAHINYEVESKPARVGQFDRLAARAEALAKQYPNRAEPLVWQAIILSTEAGAKGGMGALPLVQKAKALLERAEKINPTALNGSVYTTLGSLYYQVPGFPVGFGDKNKARAYLKKALAVNPNGIDPNYFYGDFLYQQGEYAEAARVLQRAAAAPARPGRELADRGRRAEIRELLAKVRRKVG